MGEVLVSESPFTPDVVVTPSAASIAAMQAGKVRREDMVERKIAGEGVRLELTKVRIVDGLQGGVFGWGAATGVYVITSIVDGVGTDPISFQGKVYQGVVNGETLPLGIEKDPTAHFTVYTRLQPLPQILSFNLLVLRSNEGLREVGSAITGVLNDERFKALSGIVTTAVTGVNPAYGIVWQVAQEAIGLVGEHLGGVADTQLGYYAANYTNLFDNLGIGHHPPGRVGSTISIGKIEVGYKIDVV